jgi:hypothetical protein
MGGTGAKRSDSICDCRVRCRGFPRGLSGSPIRRDSDPSDDGPAAPSCWIWNARSSPRAAWFGSLDLRISHGCAARGRGGTAGQGAGLADAHRGNLAPRFGSTMGVFRCTWDLARPPALRARSGRMGMPGTGELDAHSASCSSPRERLNHVSAVTPVGWGRS